MQNPITTAATRSLLFVIGAGLAVLLLVAARPASAPRAYPAEVEVTATATGEVETAPAAPDTLIRSSLLPGGSDSSALELRNQTGSDLSVSLAASADSTELDGTLGVRLSAGDRVLADSTLQALRRGSLPVRLAPGEATQVRISLTLPESATDYEGRQVAIELTPQIGGPR
jgi:hypothetical protein